MSRWSVQSTLGSTRHILWNLVLIGLGSAVCALGINGILIPQKFLGAGFTGISLILHYLIPAVPISVFYFTLNIPVFALGWMYVGRRFFLYSIAGMLIFSAALAIIHIQLPVHDKILSALLAGIIIGTGSGIILKSTGSAGGLDVLSVIFHKRFSIRLGTTILAFNGLILTAGAIMFSLEGALYTLIFLYTSSYMINLVVTGLNQRKAVFIISSQWEKILHEIMEQLNRGVTIIKGRGGYTGHETDILYTVINFRELSRLKKLISDVDPDGFVVISDTLEVMGRRIGNQPHW
ncbi:MAG: YitT family protein [Deltaproteobacteria bacterium]|nr:YitT family protein [Deltaproteobacteria bacterium]